MRVLKKEADKAKAKITKYQNKYGQPLSSFEQKGLEDESSLDKHDEYMDWYFWQKVYDESRKIIGKYGLFLGDEIDVP